MRRPLITVALATALVAALPAAALGQLRKLRVVSSDTVPIPYAYVTVEGGYGQITDEKGEVVLGAGKQQTLVVRIQRIGYQPWFGKVDATDTASVLTVPLMRIAQSLSTVRVTGTAEVQSLKLTGFYDRWLMRQRGSLSATFIGPEEIEKRHVSRTSDLLQGVLGVSLVHTDRGSIVAKGIGGTCDMAVLLDGQRLCPSVGCNSSTNNAPSIGARPNRIVGSTIDDNVVNINQYVNQNDIAAIEVYARGGNMPVSLQAVDNACGVIAIWTGSKKP
jgi:hypothetical protein